MIVSLLNYCILGFIIKIVNFIFIANSCLARLIGENVLRLCRESRHPYDSVAIARLYLDYAYLLETLMSNKPLSYHQSKYARQFVGADDSGGEESLPRSSPYQNSEEMSMDSQDIIAMSQYACPIKYNLTSAIQPMEVDDEDVEPLENTVCCWLAPVKYEDSHGQMKLCQCRKVLMGSAISMLKIVFDAWCKFCIRVYSDTCIRIHFV
jgi:hypothetical protein